jgi:hypothetical protein
VSCSFEGAWIAGLSCSASGEAAKIGWLDTTQFMNKIVGSQNAGIRAQETFKAKMEKN